MTTAVVVGAGPNGLAAAIRLAEAGHPVTVLEAADRAGGAVRTDELTLPGFRHDTFSSVHLHNEQLLEAVQRRCHFEDGDLRVIVLEGQPIHIQKQWYRILDAKTGLIEAGYVTIEDMASRQPWPEPGDEFPVHLTTQPVVHGES